jgi:hypothetical protein
VATPITAVEDMVIAIPECRISTVIPTPAGNPKFTGRINPPVTQAGGFLLRGPAVNTLAHVLD